MGKRKKPRRRFNWNLLSVIPVCWGICLLAQSCGYISTFWQIHAQIRTDQKEVTRLAEQLDSLEADRQNLDNPDYLNYYAPGKYFVTQNGAQVFKFPKLDLVDPDE